MLKIGETWINSVYNGSIDISKIYNGTDIVYQKNSITDWTKIDKILPTLKVGNQLNAPTAYGFDQIVFEVVDNNNNQTENHISVDGYEHTVTLQTKYLLSNTDKSVYKRSFGSSREWYASAICGWLNGSFLDAFLKDVEGNDKTGIDIENANAFINAIKSPKINTWKSASSYSTTADKMWLPSIYEVGSGETVPYDNWGKEGHVFDKYSAAPGTGYWSVRVKKSTDNSPYSWWLRTAQSQSLNIGVWGSSKEGGLGGTRINYEAGIAPCITLAYNKT